MTVDGSLGNCALSGVVVGTMPGHEAQESLELAPGRSSKGLEMPAGKALEMRAELSKQLGCEVRKREH